MWKQRNMSHSDYRTIPAYSLSIPIALHLLLTYFALYAIRITPIFPPVQPCISVTLPGNYTRTNNYPSARAALARDITCTLHAHYATSTPLLPTAAIHCCRHTVTLPHLPHCIITAVAITLLRPRCCCQHALLLPRHPCPNLPCWCLPHLQAKQHSNNANGHARRGHARRGHARRGHARHMYLKCIQSEMYLI